ncbi:MAG: hypothetical protein WDN46_08725 [Methylocella sp.]
MNMLNPEGLINQLDPVAASTRAELTEAQARFEREYINAWTVEVSGNPRAQQKYFSTKEQIKSLNPQLAIKALNAAADIFARYATATPTERQQAAYRGILDIDAANRAHQEKLEAEQSVWANIAAQQAQSFNAATFIAEVTGRGITLTLAEDGSVAAVRASLLTPADLGKVRQHKAAIVAELEARAAAVAPTVIA